MFLDVVCTNSYKKMDRQTQSGEVHACVVPSDPAVPPVACSRSPCVVCPRRGLSTRSSTDLGQSDKRCLSINPINLGLMHDTSGKCTGSTKQVVPPNATSRASTVWTSRYATRFRYRRVYLRACFREEKGKGMDRRFRMVCILHQG